MDHVDGEVTSVDAAVSPDDMDIMFQQAQRTRRGGALLDDVPTMPNLSSVQLKTSDSNESYDSLTDLPDRNVSPKTATDEDSKVVLGPMQFIKRKSLLQKVGPKTVIIHLTLFYFFLL